ncbi:MAG: hypothetical protein CMO55_04195 [Verrucomicrobiales bacterium]|nr:hypothetical protein [Verrucomicrobiales bacterium]
MPSLSPQAKSLIYSNLEKYARSGMGMEKACDSLLAQPRIGRTESEIYEGILAGLKQGKSIGESLGDSSSSVTPLEEEVVTASEEGGKLDKGFSHLAEYFRRVDRTRRRIRKGLAYPIILLHIAIPICGVITAAFKGFSLDGSAPGFSLSTTLRHVGLNLLGMYALVALIVIAAVVFGKLARTSGAIDSLLNLVPLLGKTRKAIAMERFTQVFSIFLQAGRKMSDSLLGAGKSSGSGLLREASENGAQMILQGDQLATAIHSAPSAFPNNFARGIAAAEESGQLDRELDEWAKFYSESAEESMDRLADWTPKLFYWAILIYVAVLIVRSAMAYRDLLMKLLDFGG